MYGDIAFQQQAGVNIIESLMKDEDGLFFLFCFFSEQQEMDIF